MNKLLRLFPLFIFMSKAKIMRGMQYRFDFFMGLFVSIGMSSLGPILQYLIFNKLKGYPGWNLNQIVLFQSVMLLWCGTKDVLFGEVRGNVEGLVRSGGFDRLLLKPYPPMGIIVTHGFYYQGFGAIISGLVIMGYIIRKTGLSITLPMVGVFVVFFISGILLYIATIVLYSSVVIRLVHMGRLGEILDRMLYFSRFPIEIFSPWVRLVALVVFPVALWTYLPTQTLLNRLDGTWLISLASCFVVLIGSLKVWEISLRKYTSAGG